MQTTVGPRVERSIGLIVFFFSRKEAKALVWEMRNTTGKEL
jgi:hypothetical protein